VTAWLAAALALLVLVVPCAVVACRATTADALVAVELASSLVVLAFLALAEGFGRSAYLALPVVAAPLSFVNGLVLVRFLGRGL
jgi:multisubunit Na+/H+ antiporter MnhF subunit